MIGGNTKIRLIDISSNKVYVILKEGFSINYLEKEIYIRKILNFYPQQRFIIIQKINSGIASNILKEFLLIE